MNNIVQKATCFTKVSKATLLDLILTCQECDFRKVCNFGTGISDVYNYIAVQLNCDLPKMLPKKKLCRSFKNFDVTHFNCLAKISVKVFIGHTGRFIDSINKPFLISRCYLMDQHLLIRFL
jgi:NRPS condensation-like uncharacterized protein